MATLYHIDNDWRPCELLQFLHDGKEFMAIIRDKTTGRVTAIKLNEIVIKENGDGSPF